MKIEVGICGTCTGDSLIKKKEEKEGKNGHQ